VLDFANAFVQFFNVSPTGSKIGVITYSTEANLTMDFNSFQGDNLSSDSVRDVINDLKPIKGRRKIYEALKLANEQLFVRDAGMRDDKDILKIIVVLIAGKQTSQTTENDSFIRLNETSELLRNKSVEIFVVGVGFKENIDISELIQISGKPENVLTSEKFENLVILAEDLAKVVCGKRFYHRNWNERFCGC
ncbi:Collagen alpha-1(XIV) chain, partial [Acropora cervicornis]